MSVCVYVTNRDKIVLTDLITDGIKNRTLRKNLKVMGIKSFKRVENRYQAQINIHFLFYFLFVS